MSPNESTDTPTPPGRETAPLAEDLFLALMRSRDFGFYVGQAAHLSDDELRALFGVALAALREAGRGAVAATTPTHAPTLPDPAHPTLPALPREVTTDPDTDTGTAPPKQR